MTVYNSLFLIASALILFLSGVMVGNSYKPEQKVEDAFTVVYEKDCFIEYEDRELRVKYINLEDLEELK